MCGIIGFVGDENAVPIIIEGLDIDKPRNLAKSVTVE